MPKSLSKPLSKPSSKPSSKQAARLYTLDALRGIAIVLILLFHATELFEQKLDQPFLFNSFRFADAGVELFFVLSGFTLFWTYAHQLDFSLSWGRFMANRCLRIYPFYWLINLAVIPIYFLLPTLGRGHETNLGVILKSLLLIPQQLPPVLSVAWFLSYILLFYALFGLLISLKPKNALPVLGSWIALSIVFNIVAYSVGWGGNSAAFWLHFLFSLYGIEFAAGGLMAFCLTRYSIKPVWQKAFLGWGFTAFLVFGLIDNYLLTGSNSSAMQGYEFITYGTTSVFIIGGLAASEQNQNTQKNPVRWSPRLFSVKSLLMHPLPQQLGAASYAIFLTHYLALSLCIKPLILLQRRFDFSLILLNLGMIFCCLITLWVGQLSYRYLEYPLTRFVRLKLQSWKYLHSNHS